MTYTVLCGGSPTPKRYFAVRVVSPSARVSGCKSEAAVGGRSALQELVIGGADSQIPRRHSPHFAMNAGLGPSRESR